MKFPFDLKEAKLGPGMSLVVIERDGDELEDAEVKISGDASTYLADSWKRTLAAIDAADPVSYSPEVVFRPEDNQVLVINEDVRDENEAAELLLGDEDRPLKKPADVDADSLYLYALVSTTSAGRLVMIKKTSPARRARQGKRWALAEDELRMLDDDPWQLHPTLDLVVGESGAFALSLTYFEQLFKDAERLSAKVGDWVEEVHAALPMTNSQRKVLVERCRESSRLRRRLRAITNRGHLDRVSIADVRRHAGQMGLDSKKFVKSNKLVVDDVNAGELLQLLNEDLFLGGLTGDRFRSEGKEQM